MAQPQPKQFEIGAPDLKTVDRKAYAVAKFLRHRSELKQRDALFRGDERRDMFRLKRAFRAFDSEDYQKAREKDPLLPDLSTAQSRLEIALALVMNKFICGVNKLETEQALAAQKKPASGVPVVVVAPSQTFGDNDYFVWMWAPTSATMILYTIGLVAALISMVTFQLWPPSMRQGLYYISLLAMAFLVFMLVLAVLRLVIRLITQFIAKPGIWLFPNLFADVGFLASFKPFWAWSGEQTLPPKPKRRKRRSAAAGASAAATSATTTGSDPRAGGAGIVPAAGAQPQGPAGGETRIQIPPAAIKLMMASGIPMPPGNIHPNDMLQRMVAGIKNIAFVNTKNRVEAETKGETGPAAEEKRKVLSAKIFTEEMQKGEQELKSITMELQRIQQQVNAAAAAAGRAPQS